VTSPATFESRIQQILNAQHQFEEQWPVVTDIPIQDDDSFTVPTIELICGNCHRTATLRIGPQLSESPQPRRAGPMYHGYECPMCHESRLIGQWEVDKRHLGCDIVRSFVDDIFAYRPDNIEWIEEFDLGELPPPHPNDPYRLRYGYQRPITGRAVIQVTNPEPIPYRVNSEKEYHPYSDNESQVIEAQPGQTLTVHLAPPPEFIDDTNPPPKRPTYANYPITAVYEGDTLLYPALD